MSGAAQEPSMEDILASIRRILDEDQPALPPPASADAPAAVLAPVLQAPPTQVAVAEPPADELLLDETMLDPVQSAPPAAHTVLPPSPVLHEAFVMPPAPPASSSDPDPLRDDDALSGWPPAPSVPPSRPAHDPFSLLAPDVEAETASSMSTLLRAIGGDRGAAVHSGGPTIEDLVREELRPLLKAWLDNNLPPVVERLVRAEIERVVSRAAG